MSNIDITKHQGLVHAVVNSYCNAGACTTSFSRDDAVQSGNVGLLKAAAKYDPAKGAFSTYAMYWIRDSIQEALDNTARAISIPRHVRRAAHREGIHYPAEGVTLNKYERKWGTKRSKRAWGLTPGESAETEGHDDHSVAYDDAIAEQAASDNQEKDSVTEALECLTDNERFVIREKYYNETSQKDIAEKLNCTREWVRRLEISALARMKEYGCDGL